MGNIVRSGRITKQKDCYITKKGMILGTKFHCQN